MSWTFRKKHWIYNKCRFRTTEFKCIYHVTLMFDFNRHFPDVAYADVDYINIIIIISTIQPRSQCKDIVQSVIRTGVHPGCMSIKYGSDHQISTKTSKLAIFMYFWSININLCDFKFKLLNIKQIMTGLEGNRQIYLPREIQDRLPKSFY